jgi:hypothetical protein
MCCGWRLRVVGGGADSGQRIVESGERRAESGERRAESGERIAVTTIGLPDWELSGCVRLLKIGVWGATFLGETSIPPDGLQFEG